MKVLLVEDNLSIRNVLRMSLVADGFTVDEAENGETGFYLAKINRYDIIILDNVLPKKMGKVVCQELRSLGIQTPILLLSAVNDALSKIDLLNSGADDYVTKPFSYEELVARMRALMRRPGIIQDNVLRAGNLILNVDRHEVKKNNKKIYLTKKEYTLLTILMQNRGKVLSRATIMESVWDEQSMNPFSNTIESHILNLRKKLGDRRKSLIMSIPGSGYKFLDPHNS